MAAPENPPTTTRLGIGIALGAAIGSAVGLTTGDLALWLALGVAIGVGVGAALDARARSAPSPKREGDSGGDGGTSPVLMSGDGGGSGD